MNEPRTPTKSHKSHPPANAHRRIQLPALVPSDSDRSEGFSIELVDPDLWMVTFGIAQTRNALDGTPEVSPTSTDKDDGSCNCPPMVEEFPDFDEIESLRLQKKLFYKLDKGSKEFEERNIIFHRRKSSKKTQASTKKESKKSERLNPKPISDSVKLPKQKGKASPQGRERPRIEAPLMEGKKVRTPTFNQVTDPYHLPFCLDIYITKGSVRACIVHRVTSKVVAVAHSISKDMKFDLTSRKDSTACVAVGQVLAQRAIEDDIHNVVYTPRKGDTIEGKLQIVLQSVIDHGIDVKVKLKQKKPMKVCLHSSD